MHAYRRTYFLLSLILLPVLMPAETTRAQKMGLVAAGELEFQTSCAVCHGADARGQGIMSKHLNVRPADLSHLAQQSGGKFPFWEVYRIIEGRGVVPGHGGREMPVWGNRFRADAGSDGKIAQPQAAGRILSVVFFLEHIQE